jgi:uncharacterized membrane-anchored protein YjiN (DUF445 family)
MAGIWNTSRRITRNEYDEKAPTLKQQQVEIVARIEQHQTGDEAFRATLELLLPQWQERL